MGETLRQRLILKDVLFTIASQETKDKDKTQLTKKQKNKKTTNQ